MQGGLLSFHEGLRQVSDEISLLKEAAHIEEDSQGADDMLATLAGSDFFYASKPLSAAPDRDYYCCIFKFGNYILSIQVCHLNYPILHLSAESHPLIQSPVLNEIFSSKARFALAGTI